MKDKLEELICPECGHNLIDTNYNYNPKKRLTVLKLERQSSNPEVMKLITKTVRLIKKNIPSEDNTRSEYFFMKKIQDTRDLAVKVGIHRYLEGNHVYGGKGYAYLSKIIQYTETNSERQYELEQKRLGKLPKPQRKEDIDG